MGLKIGDTLTVNLLGREITATIANLRQIDWTRLGINFAIVFAPGTLEAAPQTHLAALYGTPAGRREPSSAGSATASRTCRRSRCARRSARSRGSSPTIGDRDAAAALVTVLAGILVLGGAVAAGHRRRVYEAVVLKVLGATRRTVTAAFLIEHGLVGVAAALAAGAIGIAAAYAVVTGPMRSDWVLLYRPLAAGAAARGRGQPRARLCRNLARARRQARALPAERIGAQRRCGRSFA